MSTKQEGTELLDLPPELILGCLLYLSLDDIASCLRVGNSLLARIISDSLALRYRVEQELAGVEENPGAMLDLPTSVRLETLREREHRWHTFCPAARYTIPYPKSCIPFLYAIESGLWFLAEAENSAAELAISLHYVDLSPAAQHQWRIAFTGTPFANFTTALEEHDLLVIISCVRCLDDPSMVTLDAHLLLFSSGTPHPLAAQPVIHLHRQPATHTVDVNVEVAGHILVISCIDWEHPASQTNLLYVFDWKRGIPLIAPTTATTIGMAFLTPNVLLIPKMYNSVDIYSFSPENTTELLEYPTPISFGLPLLQPNYFLSPMGVQSRRSPNPCTGVSHPNYRRAKFPVTLDNTIIFLSYETRFQAPYGARTPQTHLFVIRPAPLLESVSSALEMGFTFVPWGEWGATCTRWLDPTNTARAWILASLGQRMIGFPPYIPGAFHLPYQIRLLDFNEHRIALLRRQRDVASSTFIEDRAISQIVEPGPPGDTLLQTSFTHFAEPVTSDIAYIETTFTQEVDFDNAYLSEECVIARRYAIDGTPSEMLEVLYFG
ncbi:hypothetical protein C8F01DRAFT_1371039 [Mycena amicta]|nr:hypothetical protein C8F01DRAFT_1371039 [Mycena amicta]